MTSRQHVYEVHPRKDKRGVDLISDALPLPDKLALQSFNRFPLATARNSVQDAV